MVKKTKFLFFINKKKNKTKNIKKQKMLKNNFLSFFINFFFKKNKKLNFFLNFLKIFNHIIKFILIKKIKKKNFIYTSFFKNIFLINKWLFNFNNFLLWLILNYEIIFCYKNIKTANNKKKSGISLIYIWKRKRKKFLLKWIKNKVEFIQKKKIVFKFFLFFLELILNFKKSNFFKFKLSIYQSMLYK